PPGQFIAAREVELGPWRWIQALALFELRARSGVIPFDDQLTRVAKERLRRRRLGRFCHARAVNESGKGDERREHNPGEQPPHSRSDLRASQTRCPSVISRS